MRYCVGIMIDTTLQLTIRGLDAETKDALVKKAHAQGISLNRYALKTLRQGAGVDEREVRYQAMKQFLNAHHMSASDKKAFDEALAWSDAASMKNNSEKIVTLVFDTTALSALLGNDDTVVRALSRQTYDRLIVPLAADAELRFGFAYGSRQAENLANYELFKRQFHLEVLNPSQDVAHIYAELAAWARQHGIALSHNDTWIAATCVHAGGKLLTLDQDFARLPQIRLVNLSTIV